MFSPYSIWPSVIGFTLLFALLFGGVWWLIEWDSNRINKFVSECVESGNVVVPGYNHTFCVPKENAQ